MLSDSITVKAKIHLIPTENGGRKTAIKSGYRPNHAFEKLNDLTKVHFYIGEITFAENESIQPGETKIVTVNFLQNEIVESLLKTGLKWFIYEVPRLVGEGEIIEI